MSTNIIRSTTYSYSYLSQPVTASIVKDIDNEQLYLIIYEADDCIYNQSIIIPKYIQQFFKTFSPDNSTYALCISQYYFAHTLVNYYTYLMVRTSRRNKNILYKNIHLYPACAKIINYCKVHSPVYYTPALQLIEESLESNWRSRTILHAILSTPLDTLE